MRETSLVSQLQLLSLHRLVLVTLKTLPAMQAK